MSPDVVVTATRVPTPVLDIPAGVSVVDRQTMEVRDYTNLVQALSAIPGIRVSQSGGPGGNASVFVRGTNSNQVLVLRDGMPLNDASDSSGAFNFGVDALADVERIEVIRGPMAALYGSGAIGGVINLISRQGREAGPHIDAELSGGYPRAILGNATVSGVNGPVDYAATFESQSQLGYDPTPTRESIYSGVPQGFRTQIGTINLGVTPFEGTRFSAFLRARTTVFGFNALGSPTFDDANSTGRAASLLGRLGATSKLFGGSVETGLFVGRLQEDRQYTEPLNALDPNQATNDSRYHAYRTDVQWNNTVHLSDYFASSVLSATDLTFGYEHIADQAKVRVNSSFFGFPFSQSANAHMDSDAGYVGLQSTLWNRLTITGQLRQDAVLNDTPFTWRLGGVLDIPEIATHLKAAYGTAFRAPSLFDRFGVDSSGYVGNPLLKPESAQGWEIGFTTDVAAFARKDFATVGVTYFNNQVQNLIQAVFAPVDTAVNIDAAHIQGFETELTLRPASWLTANVAYTYTDAQNADTQSALLRRPQNTVSITATAQPLPKLTIAPELLYTGAFQDFLVDDMGFATANIGTSKQGLIVNLTVTYQVTEQVALFASGRNLTDSQFEPVNGYRTPPASFLAGVRARF
jgi:vitamin B12 transporter